MKRLAAFILAIFSLASCACAGSVDLSGMSLAELQALQTQVIAAMWATDEWQEVTVPVGAYQVGVEIPEGKWTITVTSGQYAEIYISTELNAAGTKTAGKILAYQVIAAKDHYLYDDYPSESMTVDVKAGQYLIVESAPVIFTPYAGPSFSFK